MAIDNPGVIDAAGIENSTGDVVLSIFDSWDWSDEVQHLVAWQEKLNKYLDFIEQGRIVESYPDAAGRKFVIDIITRFPVPEIGLAFLERAREAVADLDLEIRTQHVPDANSG